MAETSTIGELYKAKVILTNDFDAAVEAYIAALRLTVFVIGEGHALVLTQL